MMGGWIPRSSASPPRRGSGSRARSRSRRRRSRGRGRRSRPAATRSWWRPPAPARRCRRSCGRSTRLLTAPVADPKKRTRVLYISPLKALGVDVERNLRSPLVGITQTAKRLGVEPPAIRVGVRSGDTPAADRRLLLRDPPDILITTPESLFLMLTSAARETPRRGRDGHRRRDPRRRRHQARRPPRRVARAARRDAAEARAAHRAVGHRAAARGGGAVPRRARPGRRSWLRPSRRPSSCGSWCRSRT